ncbi:MAG TPA: DUF3109 family protein [Bacteroidaceae bacterium]|nr:DUF3109 family protein [Bacteroidaceae bacterium]
MIQIQDVIVSLDLLTKKFSCDLTKCAGACCVEGDAGAPISEKEAEQIKSILPIIWDDLSPEAREVIDNQGVTYIDAEGDLVISIIGRKECVFVYRDEKDCCYCSIEKAYRENRCSFIKPISCYLYPIRVKRIGDMWCLNYNRWNICNEAVKKGEKEHVPLYKFLREPLVAKFGEEWYKELELTVFEMQKQGLL